LEPGTYACLQVSDTGSGMEPQVMSKIFDPYFTTKARQNGTGIGLAVVHGIVTAYQGDIDVESEVGKGSTLSVYIPLLSAEDMIKSVASEGELSRGNEHILLVDDKQELTEVLSRMLIFLGYEVSAFNRGKEGLAVFMRSPNDYDAVVTDMTMPHMTGIALAQEVKKVRPEMPVVLLTGYSETLSADKMAKLGIDASLLKPVLIRELAGALKMVLQPGSMHGSK
jgi:CheY-like chemotaxis protein